MNMFLLAQATAADPMASLIGSPTFKSLATYLLVIIAVLALFYPTALAKIKAGIAKLVDEKLHDKLPAPIDAALHQIAANKTVAGATASPGSGDVPAQLDVGQITQQRATALKAACPKAQPDVRLKWLEQGVDPVRAQVDYINMLEARIASIEAASPAPASAT